LIVEPTETDDADEIVDLWVDLAAEQEQYGSHLSADANEGAIRESILQAIVTGGLVVARSEAGDDFEAPPGTILGFVMFGFETGGLETTVTRGVIENLYVRPECRDQGVGSTLLDDAVAHLAERGAEEVKLEVMAPNEGARRFYRRHGFQPHRVQLTRSVRSDNHSKDGG